MKNIIENEYGHCHYCVCKNKECSYIYNLFVHKEHRRKGIARNFINECINLIRDTGYKGDIQIIAKPEENSISEENLIKFYEELGLNIV